MKKEKGSAEAFIICSHGVTHCHINTSFLFFSHLVPVPDRDSSADQLAVPVNVFLDILEASVPDIHTLLSDSLASIRRSLVSAVTFVPLIRRNAYRLFVHAPQTRIDT